MTLISVDALAARLDEPTLRVVDVRWYLNQPGRGRAEYEAGHIPGAIHLDLDSDLSAPSGPGRHPLPEPAVLAERLGHAGIGSEHSVVVYDDAGGTSAARLWWMLDNLGHRGGAAVLDGGIQAWVAAGGSLTTVQPEWPPAELALNDVWRGVVDRDELKDRLATVDLLDARAPERYRGEIEPIDSLAGHIPTAISMPTSGNLNEDGRMRGPGELRERYGGLGSGGRSVVVSCGSGTTACHNALAMRLAGLPDPLLYVGSFSDWSSAGMPVATGPEPGSPPPGEDR